MRSSTANRGIRLAESRSLPGLDGVVVEHLVEHRRRLGCQSPDALQRPAVDRTVVGDLQRRETPVGPDKLERLNNFAWHQKVE